MLEKPLQILRKVIPAGIFSSIQPAYHLTLSYLSALIYHFPSRKIKVIAVTGTKGKSSTVEILSAILEEAGYKVACTSTIRFKIDSQIEENLYKMSMPGRFFVQKFIRRAVNAGCDYVIMEMTSQGAILHRHKFVNIDAFVFTNLSPEHIESHGSYENYIAAKVSIAKTIEKSSKKGRTIVVNADDPESGRFLAIDAERKIEYGLRDSEPYKILPEGLDFTLNGHTVHSPLSGKINLYNILAASAAAKSQGVADQYIISAIGKLSSIPGRLQKIEAGQDFDVIVDYAHTPDSLSKLYEVYAGRRKVCVLGGTGGGRDGWKRKEMGRIAEENCSEIILTDEDPYDEDPNKIVSDVAAGIISKKPLIIMDRRLAIREAISRAKKNDVVLITGKGTDPYIMGTNGSKLPWSDARIAKEELVTPSVRIAR